jgi:hypothetical protein
LAQNNEYIRSRKAEERILVNCFTVLSINTKMALRIKNVRNEKRFYNVYIFINYPTFPLNFINIFSNRWIFIFTKVECE